MKTIDYRTEQIKYLSHEIKNQLSICDLYTEVVLRYCGKNNIEDETIIKSVENIKKAVILASISLAELKSSQPVNMKEYNLGDILKESCELSKIYGKGKNIDISVNHKDNCFVKVDKNRLIGVIINLVKNACEAFEGAENNKNISISMEDNIDSVNIVVTNNANPIQDTTNIFKEGYTTKTTGSGLGLYICKTNIEEMSGKLYLRKSDFISTEFVIEMKK